MQILTAILGAIGTALIVAVLGAMVFGFGAGHLLDRWTRRRPVQAPRKEPRP